MRSIPRTTDEDALLAAIAEEPLDDAPPLVYPDWLQERGEEPKAGYVRTVVRLLHPPEEPAAVERCVTLAEELDADWRQAVGGRFEVVLTGTGGMHLTAFLLRMVLGVFSGDLTGPWRAGDPIRLKAYLTREAAQGFLDQFRDPLLRLILPNDSSANMFVRPMDWESPLTLFAPDEPA